MIALAEGEPHRQPGVDAYRRAIPHEEIATAKVADHGGLLVRERARALRRPERRRGRAGERPVVVVVLLVVQRHPGLRGGVHRRRRGHERRAPSWCRYGLSCVLLEQNCYFGHGRACGRGGVALLRIHTLGRGVRADVAEPALKTVLRDAIRIGLEIK